MIILKRDTIDRHLKDNGQRISIHLLLIVVPSNIIIIEFLIATTSATAADELRIFLPPVHRRSTDNRRMYQIYSLPPPDAADPES